MRVAIVLAVLLAGCGKSSAAPEKSAPQFADARSAVAAGLRDPGSATFGDLRFGRSGVVCGSVNARNGFGGFTGLQPFVFVPASGRAFVFEPGRPLADRLEAAAMLKEFGCPISADVADTLKRQQLLDESSARLRAGENHTGEI